MQLKVGARCGVDERLVWVSTKSSSLVMHASNLIQGFSLIGISICVSLRAGLKVGMVIDDIEAL